MHTARSLVELLDRTYAGTDVHTRNLQPVLEEALRYREGCDSLAYLACVEAICHLPDTRPRFDYVDTILRRAIETTIDDHKPLCVLMKWYRAMGWALRAFSPDHGSQDPNVLGEVIPLFTAVLLMAENNLQDWLRAARASAMIAELHKARGEDTLAHAATRSAIKYMLKVNTTPYPPTDQHLIVGGELILAAGGVRPTNDVLLQRLYVPGELLATMEE